MPNAYILFGELKADTNSFKNSLREADRGLESTKKNIEIVEGNAESLGKATAVTGRAFEKLRDSVESAKARLVVTADAFQRGDATASQMRAALLAVERASTAVNSKLKDTS